MAAPSLAPIPRVPLLGTPVSAGRFEAACAYLAGLVTTRQRGYFSCANAYSLSLARLHSAYQSCLKGAIYLTADGMPVVWLLRALGLRATERVHNDDLFFALARRYPHWRHFLVGGRSEQIGETCAGLRRWFPAIQIAGSRATPVRPVPPAETAEIVDAIRHTGADVVWVGMGTPHQDFWMSEAVSQVDVPMVACGSLFDLLAGRTRPAPEWMKRAGLQWLFRLLQEPRRLLVRYVYHNSRFVVLGLAQLLLSRFAGGRRRDNQ